MAYEAGLVVAPTDAGLQNGLAEVKKAQSSSSGSGFSLPPQLLSKLASHPKFGPKLADPAFIAKLNMLQTNPQMMMQDPEIMEIFGLLMGGDGAADFASDNTNSNSSYNTSSSSQSTAPPPPPEPEVELTPEELKEKETKAAAVAAKERGNALYKSKQFEEALAAYDEAIALDPSAVLFLGNKAAVYIEMGEIDKAIQQCQEAIDYGRSKRAPYQEIAKLYQRMAGAYLKREDFENAKECFTKAQTEHFDKAIERKVKNLELEFKKKAIKAYINPELGAEAKERGNTAFRDNDFPTAIKEYEEAVKRDPTNAAYRNNLAAALLKMGDFNGAKREVEKSLELDSTYVKAWAKKGDIEFFMKEYHKALDSYKAGLQIEPDNALCTRGLSKTMAQINTSQSDEVNKERAAHAMADPEIQFILQDPMVRQTLQDLQENPQAAQRALADPTIRAKIDKLIASGILQVK
jgi:stress-induced-phosphoprotein 1